MLLQCTNFHCLPAKLATNPNTKSPLQISTSFHFRNSKVRFKIYCCSSNEKDHHKALQPQGFSVLNADTPWKSDDVWSTMVLYFFCLHVPMSFGGLSFVAQMLNQPNLDPQSKVVALVVIETLELFGTLRVLNYSAKPQCRPINLFKLNELRNERNWVLAALIGFVFLEIVISVTSFLADQLSGSGDGNDSTLKDILLSGSVSQFGCAFLYCILAPLLEEIVYRGFLLTSLAPTMDWRQAVILSSFIFSVGHLSIENFIQLFIIGVALGCCYCWTGDLRSSILLHSMYNALTFLITYNSIRD